MEKKFRDLDEMSIYIYEQMQSKQNISCIIPRAILDDIYYPLQSKLDLISCYREVHREYDIYVVTKKMVAGSRFVLYTEPLLYNEDLELGNDISNDWIIVVEGCIDGEDVEMLDEKEGIEFVDLDSCCENCPGECEEESQYDQLNVYEKEYIDIVEKDIIDSPLSVVVKELLAELYLQGYKDGQNCALLSVSESLRSLAERNE